MMLVCLSKVWSRDATVRRTLCSADQDGRSLNEANASKSKLALCRWWLGESPMPGRTTTGVTTSKVGACGEYLTDRLRQTEVLGVLAAVLLPPGAPGAGQWTASV